MWKVSVWEVSVCVGGECAGGGEVRGVWKVRNWYMYV